MSGRSVVSMLSGHKQNKTSKFSRFHSYHDKFRNPKTYFSVRQIHKYIVELSNLPLENRVTNIDKRKDRENL